MAYTTINKSTDYFNTKLYTGNSTAKNITGVGFQPDWVWIKNRTTADTHVLFDAVRGANKRLSSSGTTAEQTTSNELTGFLADGFSIGDGDNVNRGPSDNIVSWNWKANGAGSSNSSGSVSATVSANTTAGFSISTFTTPASGTFTVGHGLGVAPKMIIARCYNISSDWICGHDSVGWTYQLTLNSNAAKADQPAFNDTAPTSTVWTGNTANFGAGYTGLAYCFAEKKGYSKFGSYTGNGNADGTFVYTGFAPAFVLQKNHTGANDWTLADNKRPGYNENNKRLVPNSNAVEATNNAIDLLSNGFKCRQDQSNANGSGQTYIYMAFGQSIVGSNNIPATAR